MSDPGRLSPEVLDVVRRRFPDRPPPMPVDPAKPQAMVILDEFSRHSFQDSMGLWPIHPGLVPADVEEVAPDLLFVESAWAGNNGAWRYLVAAGSDRNQQLAATVDLARRAQVPSVFWNKEDPPHFKDFVGAASLCDVILTTEEAMIPGYRRRAGSARIETMLFGANARMHHPRRVERFRSGGVAFAGQYFTQKYPERRQQMGYLFPAAAAHDFSIFSRALGSDPKYQFPAPFNSHVVGSLPYPEMVNEYKRHKIFLNVNSVPDSRTMCARRIFELASCKTTVVTAASPAISGVFPADEVWCVSNADEARDVMTMLMGDDALREESAHRAWRRVARQHLYLHRTQQILEILGRPRAQDAWVIELVTGEAPDEALNRLAEELAGQSVLATPAVTIVWASLGRLSVQVRAQLESRGVVAQPPTGLAATHKACWHPGVQHDEWVLEDLVLHARHYVDEPVVAAEPAGSGRGVEAVVDSTVTHVSSGVWLVAADAADAATLEREGARPDLSVTVVDAAYLCSGVGVSTVSGTRRNGGDA